MAINKNTLPAIYFANDAPLDANSQCDCSDCDCACAVATAHPAISTHDAMQWKKATNISFFPIDRSHAMIFNADNPVRPAVLNRPAYDLLNSMTAPFSSGDIYRAHPAFPQTIIDDTCATFSYLGLIEPLEKMSMDARAIAGNGNLLTAWLHLTDHCNLRCAYCYLPHSPVNMSLETGRAAIDATFRSALSHGYHKVKFKYAGGEPLLQFNLALALHEYALMLGRQYRVVVDGVVLSNGVLLNEKRAQILKDNGLRLMISLDGMEADHDAQRHYPDGRGSFHDVAKAIDAALARHLIPGISITVSGRNAAGLPALIRWLLARDLPFNINFYRANDLSNSETLRLDDEKIIEGMNAAFDVIAADPPRHSILSMLLDRANLFAPHHRTCGVGNDYLAFNPRGGVAKCQMQIERSVGSVHLQDPLEAVRADTSGIQNLPVESKKECNQCSWRYWCAGGCPLETHRATGRYDAKSPNCQIYQALFPKVLKLEGMRLLQQAANPSRDMETKALIP